MASTHCLLMRFLKEELQLPTGFYHTCLTTFWTDFPPTTNNTLAIWINYVSTTRSNLRLVIHVLVRLKNIILFA